ncbi:hypothetical protein [Ruminococcus sp. 5_1_39BFAA]|uniref:hypothetical protein n=1 Tax=Ruminococcus sp. 5_1_39BFAA TaxID=457412 RepID=UPI003564E7C8
MADNTLVGAANAAENEFPVEILNKASGATYPDAYVTAENTLGQIIDEYGSDIGITRGSVVFENKRTGASTSDRNETVKGFGLEAGDVLAVSDDGRVA